MRLRYLLSTLLLLGACDASEPSVAVDASVGVDAAGLADAAPAPDAAPRADAAAVDASSVDAGPAEPGRIRARLEYSRTSTDVARASVAAFTSFGPMGPMGPPRGFANAAQPAFPAELEITGLDPGTYYVVAVVDRLPATAPTDRPGAEDVQAFTRRPVDVVSGRTSTVTLTLEPR